MLHCTMTGGWATEAGKEERKLCHPHFQMGTWGELYLRTHRKTGQRVRLCSELHPGVLGDVLSSRSVLSTPLPSWAFTTQCSSLTQLLSDIGWSHHCEQVLLCSCNKLECVCVKNTRVQMTSGKLHWPPSLRWCAVGCPLLGTHLLSQTSFSGLEYTQGSAVGVKYMWGAEVIKWEDTFLVN